MSDQRSLMTSALKEKLVPELRRRGFKGSFPHFHRPLATRVDFLTVQFNSAGGSFVVEIAKCGPNGIAEGFGSELPVSRLNPQFFRDRLRLGSDRNAGRSDHWFEFGRRMYDPPRASKPAAYYENVAMSVVPFLETQAEGWWNAG
jgi:uncharacterized protein DUF4304